MLIHSDSMLKLDPNRPVLIYLLSLGCLILGSLCATALIVGLLVIVLNSDSPRVVSAVVPLILLTLQYFVCGLGGAYGLFKGLSWGWIVALGGMVVPLIIIQGGLLLLTVNLGDTPGILEISFLTLFVLIAAMFFLPSVRSYSKVGGASGFPAIGLALLLSLVVVGGHLLCLWTINRLSESA